MGARRQAPPSKSSRRRKVRNSLPCALGAGRTPGGRALARFEYEIRRRCVQARLRGVELPVALFDAASPLVPGDGGADRVRASSLAAAAISCCVLPCAKAS